VLAEADRTGAKWWYWSNDPRPLGPDGGWGPLADHLARGTGG
jgi:hypothetical protein